MAQKSGGPLVCNDGVTTAREFCLSSYFVTDPEKPGAGMALLRAVPLLTEATMTMVPEKEKARAADAALA
jgi:hypothetical protein